MFQGLHTMQAADLDLPLLIIDEGLTNVFKSIFVNTTNWTGFKLFSKHFLCTNGKVGVFYFDILLAICLQLKPYVL
jgi:hypothetical protein